MRPAAHSVHADRPCAGPKSQGCGQNRRIQEVEHGKQSRRVAIVPAPARSTSRVFSRSYSAPASQRRSTAVPAPQHATVNTSSQRTPTRSGMVALRAEYQPKVVRTTAAHTATKREYKPPPARVEVICSVHRRMVSRYDIGCETEWTFMTATGRPKPPRGVRMSSLRRKSLALDSQVAGIAGGVVHHRSVDQ